MIPAFFVGLLAGVGLCVGVLVLRACMAASRGDDMIERMREREDLRISPDEGVQYGHQLSQLRRRYDDEQRATGGRSW